MEPVEAEGDHQEEPLEDASPAPGAKAEANKRRTAARKGEIPGPAGRKLGGGWVADGKGGAYRPPGRQTLRRASGAAAAAGGAAAAGAVDDAGAESGASSGEEEEATLPAEAAGRAAQRRAAVRDLRAISAAFCLALEASQQKWGRELVELQEAARFRPPGGAPAGPAAPRPRERPPPKPKAERPPPPPKPPKKAKTAEAEEGPPADRRGAVWRKAEAEHFRRAVRRQLPR